MAGTMQVPMHWKLLTQDLHRSTSAPSKGYHIYPGPAEGTDEHALLATKNGFSYRSLIGEVLYAYVGCRLDIGYGTATLAKFNSAPQDQHYGASKGLAKYL